MDFEVSSKTCLDEQVLPSDLAMGNAWSQVMKSLNTDSHDQERDSVLGGEPEGVDEQCSCVRPCQLFLKGGTAPSHCPLLPLAQALVFIWQ